MSQGLKGCLSGLEHWLFFFFFLSEWLFKTGDGVPKTSAYSSRAVGQKDNSEGGHVGTRVSFPA